MEKIQLRAGAKLSLGPVLFNWEADTWRDFYFRIAEEAPVDVVYIGEVVCAKRAPFIAPHLDEVVERLERCGKQVVLSSLALVMTRQERKQVRDTATAGAIGHLVEANDASALSVLTGRDHVIGPFMNTYNEDTLAYFARLGAKRICVPSEVSAESLKILAAKCREIGVELEMLVYGRVGLALSARCYHARAHGLHKDGCRFVCAEDPDGRTMTTMDNEPFLAINGTQTMSFSYLNLINEIDALVALGAHVLRINPHSHDMVAVASHFRDHLDGAVGAEEAATRLTGVAPDVRFSNGFFHGSAGYTFVQGSVAD